MPAEKKHPVSLFIQNRMPKRRHKRSRIYEKGDANVKDIELIVLDLRPKTPSSEGVSFLRVKAE